MSFKNDLEEKVFDTAKRICGDGVTIEHNKVLEIERAIFLETASFSGPPKKEIDVITARLNKTPEITLLISCKQFDGSRAEPAHLQEWAAVVHTMNRYAQEKSYLGLVVSKTGFTRGCEAWATSSNIGLIPPLKGTRVVFSPDTVLRMFERVMVALVKRLAFPFPELCTAPSFYDFVFRLTADFEGHEEATFGGSRYVLTETGWSSSFGELVAMVRGKTIIEILSTTEFVGVRLQGDTVFRFANGKVLFGPVPLGGLGQQNTPVCRKNILSDDCSFDFIKQLVTGRAIVSAGDFGSHFEFGLDNEINLGFYPGAIHVVSTKNPIEEHAL